MRRHLDSHGRRNIVDLSFLDYDSCHFIQRMLAFRTHYGSMLYYFVWGRHSFQRMPFMPDLSSRWFATLHSLRAGIAVSIRHLMGAYCCCGCPSVSGLPTLPNAPPFARSASAIAHWLGAIPRWFDAFFHRLLLFCQACFQLDDSLFICHTAIISSLSTAWADTSFFRNYIFYGSGCRS